MLMNELKIVMCSYKLMLLTVSVLFFAACNTAQHIPIERIEVSHTDVSLDVKPIDLSESHIRMYRGDMKGNLSGGLAGAFSPGAYSEKDAKALTETVIYALEHNGFINNSFKKKYYLEVKIPQFMMHIGGIIPNSKFLTRIECGVYDYNDNLIYDLSFSLCFRQVFYFSIGSLKSNVNETIAYKITVEMMNQFAGTERKADKYKNAEFFKTYSEAEYAFRSSIF